MARVASKESSVKKEYEGNYGQHYYILLPIPKNPLLAKDKWGFEWFILGETDEDF